MPSQDHDKPLMHLFVHIGKLINETLRGRLAAKGIHFGQARILLSLQQQGKLTQTTIARGLHIKSATVTNLIKKMETAGLVVRQRAPHDDRVIHVVLSQAGQEAAQFAENVFDQVERDIRSQLDEETVRMLRKPLETVRNTLGGQDPTL